MPSFFSTASKGIRMLDLFPTAKLVRYNGETEYNSTTGGLVSIMVITIFIILFASMGLRTVKKEIIQSEVKRNHESTPSQLQITTGQEPFMFAAFIYGFNLTTLPKMFDFAIVEQTYAGFSMLTQTTTSLVPCTYAHFSQSGDIKTNFDRMGMSGALCPPLGHTFTVEGKLSGASYKHFKLTINRCNPTTDPTCLNDATFAALEASKGYFTLAIPSINTNINSDSTTYKEFYVADQNLFGFSSQLGVQGFANIQKDTIETDLSLLPFEDVQTQPITHIPETMTSASYIKTSAHSNAQIIFRKSPKSVTYKRTFNKLDAYFSYVGGLVGTIIGLIFIMGPYTERAYQVSLARKVLLANDGKEISSRSYHIGFFLLSYLKAFLDLVGVNPDWPRVQAYDEASDEVTNQIDVTYIVRKLLFIDAAVAKLMEKHELETLCMREKPTLDKAKEERKMHFRPEIFQQQREKELEDEASAAKNTLSPKERLMEDSLGPSPKNIVFQKRPNLSHNTGLRYDEDASAMDFSQKEVQVQSIMLAAEKVMREGQRGKEISKSIIADIDEKVVKEITEQPKRRRTPPNVAEVEVIHATNLSSEDYDIMKVANLDVGPKDKEEK